MADSECTAGAAGAVKADHQLSVASIVGVRDQHGAGRVVQHRVCDAAEPGPAVRAAADGHDRRSLGYQLVHEPADRRPLAELQLRVVEGLNVRLCAGEGGVGFSGARLVCGDVGFVRADDRAQGEAGCRRHQPGCRPCRPHAERTLGRSRRSTRSQTVAGEWVCAMLISLRSSCENRRGANRLAHRQYPASGRSDCPRPARSVQARDDSAIAKACRPVTAKIIAGQS